MQVVIMSPATDEETEAENLRNWPPGHTAHTQGWDVKPAMFHSKTLALSLCCSGKRPQAPFSLIPPRKEAGADTDR